MSGQIRAVIFDLDGVLVDSEQVWDAARRQLTEYSDGRWSESATQDTMGMSSIEWCRYRPASNEPCEGAPTIVTPVTVSCL